MGRKLQHPYATVTDCSSFSQLSRWCNHRLIMEYIIRMVSLICRVGHSQTCRLVFSDVFTLSTWGNYKPHVVWVNKLAAIIFVKLALAYFTVSPIITTSCVSCQKLSICGHTIILFLHLTDLYNFCCAAIKWLLQQGVSFMRVKRMSICVLLITDIDLYLD